MVFSYSSSSNSNFDAFSQIYTLEQENLVIDAVALGHASESTLGDLPLIDLSPSTIDAANDDVIDYYESYRDYNNGQIDQILQGMTPPPTPTGGACQ